MEILLHPTTNRTPQSSKFTDNGLPLNGTTSKQNLTETRNGSKYRPVPCSGTSHRSGLENGGYRILEDRDHDDKDGISHNTSTGHSSDHYARDLYFEYNLNQNASGLLKVAPQTATPTSSKRLILDTEPKLYPIDCVGRRRQPIGEKCFALLLIFIVTGIGAVAFGATCIIPVNSEVKLEHCRAIGGFITGLVIVCGGASLLLLVIISCVLIHECSGRELHGGKCHINCHLFEDLVE